MPKIKFDELEYNSEDLTETGKATRKLAIFRRSNGKARNEMAVYQTAHRTYMNALKTEIENQGILPIETKE